MLACGAAPRSRPPRRAYRTSSRARLATPTRGTRARPLPCNALRAAAALARRRRCRTSSPSSRKNARACSRCGCRTGCIVTPLRRRPLRAAVPLARSSTAVATRAPGVRRVQAAPPHCRRMCSGAAPCRASSTQGTMRASILFACLRAGHRVACSHLHWTPPAACSAPSPWSCPSDLSPPGTCGCAARKPTDQARGRSAHRSPCRLRRSRRRHPRRSCLRALPPAGRRCRQGIHEQSPSATRRTRGCSAQWSCHESPADRSGSRCACVSAVTRRRAAPPPPSLSNLATKV